MSRSDHAVQDHLRRPRILAKAQWLDHGLGYLAEYGPENLTIDKLARSAGVTKGSFYHHFADQQDFIRELMAHWRRRDTQALHEAVAALEPGWMQRAAIAELISALDPKTEIGVRRLAALEPLARAAVRAADEERMAFGTAQIMAHRGLDEAEARSLAEFEYSACIGSQLLFGDDPEAWRAKFAEYVQIWLHKWSH
jgi:AcrR family transcriptional regulator